MSGWVAVFMREIVIGNLRLILTIVLILPLTAIADTKDSRVVESRYLSIQLGPEIEQTDLLFVLIRYSTSLP